jgi:hypothetical protein
LGLIFTGIKVQLKVQIKLKGQQSFLRSSYIGGKGEGGGEDWRFEKGIKLRILRRFSEILLEILVKSSEDSWRNFS